MPMEFSSDPAADLATPASSTPDLPRSRFWPVVAWGVGCLALTAAYLVVGYAVARGLGLPIHWPLGHLLGQARIIVLLAYVPLVLAYFAHAVLGPRARMQTLAGRLLSPRFFVEFLCAMVAIHATLMMFVNLKQFVPAINPKLWDYELTLLDRWLHFGWDPAATLTHFAAEWGLLPFLDRAYLVFFPVQVVVPLLFLMHGRLRPARGRFFFAYCLLWMIGSLVYALVPSVGPIYYDTASFPDLPRLAPYANQLQAVLIRDYEQFRSNPSYYEVKLYYGVAALPSLHVGMITLFAIATRRLRIVAGFLWALTAVTFVGSMALGWHYAIDGYAGAFLAILVWWVAARAVGREQPTGDPALEAGPSAAALVPGAGPKTETVRS